MLYLFGCLVLRADLPLGLEAFLAIGIVDRTLGWIAQHWLRLLMRAMLDGSVALPS